MNIGTKISLTIQQETFILKVKLEGVAQGKLSDSLQKLFWHISTKHFFEGCVYYWKITQAVI